MPLVIKDKKAKTPHLALTHELQGGAANLRNVSLLMKNKDELSEDVIKALEGIGISLQQVDKAAFYSQMRSKLSDAVRSKYADEGEWLYVEDFNDTVVIFCNDKGLYSTEYSIVDGEVSIGDLANPMTSVLVYEPTSGNMLLSEDAEDKLEEGVYGLVTKALSNSESVEHLTEMFKSIENKKVIILQEEIQKAVAEAETLLKSQIADLQSQLEKAQADVAKYEEAAKEIVAKSRKETLASVVAAEEVEVLFKSLESLADEAFEAVVKTLKAKEEKLEESDLFVQKSKNSDVEQEEVNGTAAILKAKYAAQQ